MNNQMDLNKLTKKELIELLYQIHCEARDFYAQYQDHWQFPGLTDKKLIDKDGALDEAWKKFHTIMDWSDGINVPNLEREGSIDF